MQANRISFYRELSKSGIVALVCISVIGGYLASISFDAPFDLTHFLATFLGIALLASGSSALNQVQERFVDARMDRTAKRPLPSGKISLREATFFVWGSIIVGLALLALISPAVVGLGLLAVLSYNGLYTLWWKRHWPFAAVPGAIPGALPILMGSVAATGNLFHPSGFYLFALLFFWQMPHFWVLAIRYAKDYEQGGVPTLPVAHGTELTLYQIVIWCLCYVALALVAPLFFKVGWVFFIPALAASGKVVLELYRYYRHPEEKGAWLRFFLWVNFSLIIYIAAIVIDRWSVYLNLLSV